MKILITGGAGFIGSNLVKSLLGGDHEIVVLDNLSTGEFDNIKEFIEEIEFLEEDIRNYSGIEAIFEGVDAVVHLAAQSDVNTSVQFPKYDADVNINGTLNVLLACREYKVKKLVFTSSAAVYGDPRKVPIRESTPLRPISPYGISKMVAERYIEFFSRNYGINAIIFRIFNVYGKGSRGVVWDFIKRIVGDKEITIYGDGNQTRDFIYIEDVVEALKLAIKSDVSGTFNLASGEETSINQIISILRDKMEKEVRIKHKKARKGDIRYSLADISKLKEELNFSPRYSLEEGIEYLLRELE